MNNRHSPLYEFKAADIAPSGIFTGYASTFGGEPDAYGDVVVSGAFTASLLSHASKGTMPALLWQHDSAEPIGRWTELKEDGRGLVGKGKLTLGTQRGADAHALMKDGALALSIGFCVPSGGIDYQGHTRLLKSIDLIEVSAVALPANPNAKIIGVKSLAGIARPENIREFENLMRSCGFSSREARRCASAAWPVLNSVTDDVDESAELAAIAQLIEKTAANFQIKYKGY